MLLQMKTHILLVLGAQLSPDSGFFNHFKFAKGSKLTHGPKYLKHYIRKQTSFYVQTALLKSELNGVCALEAPSSASFRNHPLKPFISDKNPDLLEVYCTKV